MLLRVLHSKDRAITRGLDLGEDLLPRRRRKTLAKSSVYFQIFTLRTLNFCNRPDIDILHVDIQIRVYLRTLRMSLENHIISLLRSVSLTDSLPNGENIECPISILNLGGHLLAQNEHMAELLQLKHPSGHWRDRCPRSATRLVQESFQQTSSFGSNTITRPILSANKHVHLVRPNKQLININGFAFIFTSTKIIQKDIDTNVVRLYSLPNRNKQHVRPNNTH